MSLGSRLTDAVEVHDALKKDGYDITVADARFAKPIDKSLVKNLYLNHDALLFVEEGSVGGFSSQCLNYLSSKNLLGQKPTLVKCLTLPDFFQDQGSQKEQLMEAKLDKNGILHEVKNIISILNILPKVENKIG